MFFDGCFEGIESIAAGKRTTHVFRNEGTVLDDVFEGPILACPRYRSVLFIHPIQRILVVEAKVASMDDVLGIDFFCHAVDER